VPWLPSFLQPAPPSPDVITDPTDVARAYRFWRSDILVSSIVAYALFYFVRKNLSVAMPVMEEQLGITKSSLGLFLTLHGLIYGLSKFGNGIVGDRANARTFLVTGLALSAACNVLFGLSTAVIAFGLVWMLNGWFQGMGFPPCARLMTHWFPPRRLATVMSVWNISHSIGAGSVVVLCGYLVSHYGDWRLCFFVPAGLATVGGIVLLFTLRDTPPSVGLPEVEGTEEVGVRVSGVGFREDGQAVSRSFPETRTPTPETRSSDFRTVLIEKVFSNRYIWVLSLANVFVYTIRYAVLDWGPTLLKEAKGMSLSSAGWNVAAFELAGVTGMLAGGWVTDRLFGGRGARTCVFCMILCGLAVLVFWKLPPSSPRALTTGALMAAGFFIYAPQALVGIAAANLATKQAAATAVGLTGIFGYASSILSGWGLGTLVEHYGWDRGFVAMVTAAGIGAAVFLLAWPAKAHGYGQA
jgi:OPA family glycerol-3-phosphate transporter-like MFS transporter/OPA family sugar phosphate sensor protein UhpC-like MFS transporter